VQAHPQKFGFVEIPGKIPENLGKHGTQRFLTSNNCAQRFRKNKWRPFFGIHTKRGLHDLCWGKFVGKSRTTTFWASLGIVGHKSFAPQKICLLLHLWMEALPFE